MSETGLDTFLDAYIECALWSTMDDSTDQGGNPLDDNYGVEDIDPQSLAEQREQCKDFLEAHPEEPIVNLLSSLWGDDLKKAGHDFWLTKQGHGAGFWDGDWDQPMYATPGVPNVGEALTKRAKAYGSIDPYVGDDGMIYF